jgi:DNA-binding transcriptional LysR family regulator
MNNQQLQIFAKVAEMKSFTKAAESLRLPKASISTHIQQLENDVGTRLFHRTTRSVQLTQDGQAFYERCKDMLSDFDELRTMFQEGESGLSGRIRVDMPSRAARFKVIPKLPEFLKLHPRIEIELGSTDRLVDLVHEGYDLVIRGGIMPDSSLMAKKIGETKVITCVSPAYIKKYGKPKSLEDLKNHVQVNYVSSFGEKPEGFEYFDGKEFKLIPMKSSITVNNAEAYIAACLAGLGLIQNPISTLQKHLKEKTLIEVLPQLKSEPMPSYLVFPNQRNLPRRVKVFMTWLEKVMNEPESA